MLYKVKLDIFEGPFELLVYLIENAEMSIYDIQVSEITRQYIEYVEQINKVDAALAGEFMVLAASLIEIKSKMLLPRKCDESGPDTAEDPRGELVQRLLEYKKYKFAAACLEEQEERQQRIYTKPQEDLAIYTRETDYYLSLDLIPFIRAFELFLQKEKDRGSAKRYNIIKLQQMSIESRIEQIRHLFRRKRVFKFRELLGGEKAKRTSCSPSFPCLN